MTNKESTGDLLKYCQRIRRHLHQYPELSFQEEKTAQFILEELKALGIQGHLVAGTGVYAVIDSGKPGPTLALRADMDALPLQEESDQPYASRIPGIMHACGHDGHMAIIMGLASQLSTMTDHMKGKLLLIFQPAEETPPGGALGIIDEGILDHVDGIFGFHLLNELPTGTIGLKEGPLMAAADRFQLEIIGQGGHASRPHDCIDPVLIGTQIVNGWQSIVSRKIDPMEEAVVSVSTFNAGSYFNIIPEKAVLSGTVRTLSEPVRQLVEEEMEILATKIAQAHGAQAILNYHRGYPVLVSHDELIQVLRKVGREALGPEQVVEVQPLMGGEDFAFYCERMPGAYFFLGSGREDLGLTLPWHSPRFDFDEETMVVGVRICQSLLREFWQRA